MSSRAQLGQDRKPKIEKPRAGADRWINMAVRISPRFARLVRSGGTRSTLAPRPITVRGGGLGIHAPADASRHGHPVFYPLAGAFSELRRAGASHRRRSALALARPRVLPDDDEAIASLPGIGPYTAGAIASFAFDRPAPTVDGNIARVLARLFDFAEPIDTRAGQEKIWQTARDLLPPKNGREYTSALMELGALLCTPRAPQCLICPVREYCSAKSPESLPVKKPRARITPMLEECGWCPQRGRILLEYQSGLRWRGLWKLPLIAAPDERRALFEAVYPFTKYRVTLRVFAIPPPAALAENQAWIPRSQIATLPLTAPHRRAIESLLEQTATPHRTLRGFRSVEIV
jgi:A/G-specific adenine glycosylase